MTETTTTHLHSDTNTVLPAKSDSDVMFVYNIISVL